MHTELANGKQSSPTPDTAQASSQRAGSERTGTGPGVATSQLSVQQLVTHMHIVDGDKEYCNGEWLASEWVRPYSSDVPLSDTPVNRWTTSFWAKENGEICGTVGVTFRPGDVFDVQSIKELGND